MLQLTSSVGTSKNNKYNPAIFEAFVDNSQKLAAEQGDTIEQYMNYDYSAYPEGWNNAFATPYDELSNDEKDERKQIVADYMKYRQYH